MTTFSDTFNDSPFLRKRGPVLYLDVPAVALLVFGAAKIVAAIFQGRSSLVLGAAFLTCGGLLLGWQATLRTLFRSRYSRVD